MTVLLENRRDLDLDNFYRVAWQDAPVRLSQAALDRIALRRTQFLALVEGDNPPFVYGVTTGYGLAAKQPLDRDGRLRQAREKPSNQGVSVGRPLPERVARGIVLARLSNYVEGHAAVSPAFAAAVAAELDRGKLPDVPMEGNACGGEMNALAHVFSRLSAEYEFEPKEANALTNGSPCAAALVADAAIAAARRMDLALNVAVLAIEALKAPIDHFEPVLGDLWQDPFSKEVIAALFASLEGAGTERRSYQAPLSYRIIPQILAQVLKATREAETVAAQSLSSVTDNPIYLPPDARFPKGRCISNGGFHNAAATTALDGLTAAWADLCLLSERHAVGLLNGTISGLPHWLPTDDGFEPFRYVPWAILGLAEQARTAAQRTLLPPGEGAGYGQTDMASPVFLAWEKSETAGRCLDAALASLAVVAIHALDVTTRTPPPRLLEFTAWLRGALPSPTDTLPTGKTIQPVIDAFTGHVFNARGARRDISAPAYSILGAAGVAR
jgi:histidine ammonia-lyase